jgi:hypothetical protein
LLRFSANQQDCFEYKTPKNLYCCKKEMTGKLWKTKLPQYTV